MGPILTGLFAQEDPEPAKPETKAPVWTFDAGGFIESTPVTDGKNAFFGTRSGYVYAVKLATGKKSWEFLPDAFFRGFHASPMLNEGTIYIMSHDYYLYAVNPDGTEKWKFVTEGISNSTPSIGDDGTIYVGSSDEHLYAVNPDGTMKWKFYTGKDLYDVNRLFLYFLFFFSD